MKKIILTLSVLIALSVTTASAQQKVTTKDLDRLFKLMCGSFSSEAQSKRDSDYFDIRLHMKPIWKEKQGEYWLYVEQAMAAKIDQPYRQRVYHLHLINDSTIASDVYNFKSNPLKYAGEWKKEKPLDGVPMDSLEARDGCIIYLHKTNNKLYEGSTKANDCTSNLRGASYATSEAHIGTKGMFTWDRGFDKNGKQVWGAVKGGYDFKKKEKY